MSVVTWQTVNSVATLLPDDLRVGNPAHLDMSHIVYEAPANAHRSDFHVPRVRTPAAGDFVHGTMGRTAARVPAVYTRTDGY